MEKETTGVINAPHSITEIVKGTTAEFSRYHMGSIYYTVKVADYVYEFPIKTFEDTIISVEKEVATESEGTIIITVEVPTIKLSGDIGEADFDRTYKAITLMRYIRKAIADNTLRWDKLIA
jgi:hypothetical protein